MPLADIRARLAREKAAGVVHTYSHAAPARRVGAAPGPVSLPVLAPCAHGGTDADIVERCPSCNGGGRHVRECEVHERCTWDEVGGKVMSCAKCRREGLGYSPPAPPVWLAPGTAVVIDHGAGGIGDGLLGLTVVAKFKADNPGAHVTYNAGRAAVRATNSFVGLFHGYDRLGESARTHCEDTGTGARQMNRGYSGECVHDNSQRPFRSSFAREARWQRYARNIGATGYLIPALREPERVRALGSEFAGAVALCPFSTDPARVWSVHHWLTLEALLVRAGYRTVVLHDQARGTERFRGAKVIGAPADRVAGVLLNAACVVGSDHGLSHLGGILGAPTVVMGGGTPVDRIYGLYPRVTCLQGSLSCSGCCGGAPADATCQKQCANLQTITPERVLREVDRVWLKETLAAGRSLITADRLAVLRDEVIRTNGLPGECAELGSFRGGSAKLIRHYAAGGTLHLFDTFSGLPEDDAAAGGKHKAGEFACGLDEVRAFVGTEGVAYHPGRFPNAIPTEGTRFRFVHLDADTYQSTAAALAYFAPRMVSGGAIVQDDYGWWKTPGVERAVREADLTPERTAAYQAVIRF